MAMFINVSNQQNPKKFRENTDFLEGYTNEELRQRFRFGKDSILFIADLIRDSIRRKTKRNKAVSIELQVLITLRFFASGSFLQVIADTFRVDKSTVSRVVFSVSSALCEVQQRFIKWPTTNEEKRRVREGFFEMANFPCVIGCIDGTHIRIQAPTDDEPAFVNRKMTHSINTQAICDHEGKFTNIVAKWPGATHDSHIFRSSQVHGHLETTHRSLEDGLLLGDSGYALRNFIMTPYAQPQDHHQRKFNSAHKTTRCTIERTFGRWKLRFHILHSEIRMSPEWVCRIIGACGVLHNIAILQGEPDVIDLPVEDAQPAVVPYAGGQNDGRAVRNFISQTYF